MGAPKKPAVFGVCTRVSEPCCTQKYASEAQICCFCKSCASLTGKVNVTNRNI